MTKQQINARISDHTRAQLDALCAAMGETQTGVITIAIDRMAQDDKERTMKADIVSKTVDSRNARLELRSGAKGTGQVVKSVLYWPGSPRSEEEAYRILSEEAIRLGVTLTQHDPD